MPQFDREFVFGRILGPVLLSNAIEFAFQSKQNFSEEIFMTSFRWGSGEVDSKVAMKNDEERGKLPNDRSKMFRDCGLAKRCQK